MSTFSQLRQLLNSSLDEIESELTQAGFPELDTLTLHPTDNPQYTPTRSFYRARGQAIGCLGQLLESIQPPAERLLCGSLAAHLPAALRTIIEADIPDILPPSSKKGESAAELAGTAKMDTKKLTKLMRFLSSQSIVGAQQVVGARFAEIEEGVFAHNRASLLLQKGSPIRDFVDFQTWHSLPHATFASPVYRDPETATKWGPLDCPVAIRQDFKGRGFVDLWDYLKTDHPDQVIKFGRAMTALGSTSASGTIADYPWMELPKDSRIVDVGGGEGALLIEIMRAFPNRFSGVVQDRAEVVPLARTNFEKHLPEALDKVRFEAHNFFEKQPEVGENVVYVLRWVLHDHPDDLAIAILTKLREACQPGTRILINDTIMQPSTPSTNKSNTEQGTFDAPLLTSGGHASRIQSLVDLEMMQTHSSTERTVEEFKSLLKQAGLAFKGVWHTRGPHGVVEAGLP